MPLERPEHRPAGPVSVLRDLSLTQVVNAAVAFVFLSTGPVAIMLAVGTRGGLAEAEIASWMFGAFFVNGLVSVAYSLVYRQPLVMLWSIPGTVLVGPALTHMTFAEVTGTFFAAGALMLLLGLSGLVRRAMEAVPMPIVMGMVAGVFLPFGLDLVRAFDGGAMIAAPMTAAFLAVSAWPALARRLPPLIVALAVGIAVAVATGAFELQIDPSRIWAAPLWRTPQFSAPAMIELVIPLAIAVLVVQNGQGMAVLKAAGHEPPMNAIAAACGATSMLVAFLGTVTTCLTGPVSAILASGGDRKGQYAGAVLVGLVTAAFGLAAPLFTRLLLAAPKAFIATLAGLAMLKVLEGAFAGAFKGRYTIGALIAFLVTVAGLPILNIGAPFWGLVLGYAGSWLMEREHWISG